MDAKYRTKQILGGLAFLVGCAFLSPLLLMLISGHINNIWKIDNAANYFMRIAAVVLFASFAAYFLCTGLRMVSPRLLKPFRFGWGKILLGVWILFSEISSHFHLVPEGPLPLLKPSNETQALSMKATGIAICVLSVFLIFRGVRAGFRSHKSVRHESDSLAH
jgi:hypothetical protein